MHWLSLEPVCEFLCISVFTVVSGLRVKLAGHKSALIPRHSRPLHPRWFYSTDRSKAMVPVLVLLVVALWFILQGDLFYVLPCDILFLCFFFSPFSIAITSLWLERANRSAFRTFVRFSLVWCCLFPLSLGVWEGLRCVILAHPGFFLLPFFSKFASWSAFSLSEYDLVCLCWFCNEAFIYVGTITCMYGDLNWIFRLYSSKRGVHLKRLLRTPVCISSS